MLSVPQIGFQFIPDSYKSNIRPKSNQVNRKIVPIMIPQPRPISFHAISIQLTEQLGRAFGSVSYQTEIYNRETIQKFLKDYINLLQCIVNEPKIRISEMNIKPQKSIAI